METPVAVRISSWSHVFSENMNGAWSCMVCTPIVILRPCV